MAAYLLLAKTKRITTLGGVIMAISLTKGQKTNLTKENPNLKKIIANKGKENARKRLDTKQ